MTSTNLALMAVWFAAAAAGYRVLWRSRFGRSFPRGVTRLHGQVASIGGGDGTLGLRTRAFELVTRGGQRHGVVAELVCLAEGCVELHLGQRLTVDAVAISGPAPALYRSAAIRPMLAAVRVACGAWPELGFLDWLGGIALLGLTPLVACMFAPAVELDEALVCPTGTVWRGAPPPADDLEWCEVLSDWRQPGAQDAVKHGPWRVWWGPGRVRQRGRYVGGTPDGEWSTWYPNGQLAESGTYNMGRKTGEWIRWAEDGQVIKTACYAGELEIDCAGTSLEAQKP